jgi:hypothetical protein
MEFEMEVKVDAIEIEMDIAYEVETELDSERRMAGGTGRKSRIVFFLQ